jgi:hypothetical protein
MTNELVKRLRGLRVDGTPVDVTMGQAADEIERLTRDMSALQSQWDDMQQGFVEVFGEPVRDAIELLGATEQMRSSHEPFEQHSPVRLVGNDLFIDYSPGLCWIQRRSPQRPTEPPMQPYEEVILCLAQRLTQGASRDAPGVVQRVCHALTDDCVMVTDLERPPCTPENCKAVKASRDASSTRVTVGCSQCTATVSLPQRDGVVDIDALGLWYFSTPTGWRCPAHAPAQRTFE